MEKAQMPRPLGGGGERGLEAKQGYWVLGVALWT